MMFIVCYAAEKWSEHANELALVQISCASSAANLAN